MPRLRPNRLQNLLCSVVLPLLSIALLPLSVTVIVLCIIRDRALRLAGLRNDSRIEGARTSRTQGCVIISGGRMTKGLHLARAFKRAGWKVIGVDEQGWGDLCAMRASSAIDKFYLLPSASDSYSDYEAALIRIAQAHGANLFIPVSGVASSVEDAKAAKDMFKATKGRCRTFIQDPETMLDLHEKDRFMDLVEKLGFTIPLGKRVGSLSETMGYLQERQAKGGKEKYIFKCMGIDENRGDMTLFPLDNDRDLAKTKRIMQSLPIREHNPYVFQEFIPGQEYCTHASVINGRITSFVCCPSNDMLMTYENVTQNTIGRRAEEWTKTFLDKLAEDPTRTGKKRTLTGHFSFDFIVSDTNGEMYPIECNARVHTAVIMLPLSGIAKCYDNASAKEILRPQPGTLPRTWFYNDLIMRYLPLILPKHLLATIHPSLPACAHVKPGIQPSEAPFKLRIEPTLIADDWKPFLVMWHIWWPYMLLSRWWEGRRWTRLNVSTGRIFEA